MAGIIFQYNLHTTLFNGLRNRDIFKYTFICDTTIILHQPLELITRLTLLNAHTTRPLHNNETIANSPIPNTRPHTLHRIRSAPERNRPGNVLRNQSRTSHDPHRRRPLRLGSRLANPLAPPQNPPVTPSNNLFRHLRPRKGALALTLLTKQQHKKPPRLHNGCVLQPRQTRHERDKTYDATSLQLTSRARKNRFES